MNQEELEKICFALKGSTSDIKWEHNLTYCVGEKMYFILNFEEKPMSASFKVPAEAFDEFCEKPGCKPAPYLARYKWIWVDDVQRFGKSEWEKHLKQSYELVLSTLPKAKKEKLAS